MDGAAKEFLRALRGRRSQLGFSRRLGYRSNVVAKWEQGRRVPTAATVLRAAQKVGVPVTEALLTFSRRGAQAARGLGGRNVAAWLSALRGGQALHDIASRSGLSRYQVARCLSGQTTAALPVFFALVQAMTGRLPELVASLVDIEKVPSLLREYRDQEAARSCAYRYPWSAVLLALIEADPEALLPDDPGSVAACAERLRVDRAILMDSLGALVDSRILGQAGGRYRIEGPFVADTGRSPRDAALLREHWAQASADRIRNAGPRDLFSHNVFAVSRQDYEAIRTMQADFFRSVRARIARSGNSEVAAMITVHLISWSD